MALAKFKVSLASASASVLADERMKSVNPMCFSWLHFYVGMSHVRVFASFGCVQK